MIATVSGRIAEVDQDSLVVEVGGVGLRVFVPEPLLLESEVGRSIFLHTYTHLATNQDILALYGFRVKEEYQYFVLLIGANRVGPKLALAILSSLSPEVIHRAVANGQPEVLKRVKGVGEKAAQQIILHLKGKLPDIEGKGRLAAVDEADEEVLAALVSLGYSVVEAQTALQSIPKDAPDSVEARIKLALSYFSTPSRS
jgi:Holliday junction DNA helicase RuvA